MKWIPINMVWIPIKKKTKKLFGIKQKSSWHFQLDVDYLSNKINKNKYKNFQLIASPKSNLQAAEEQIKQGIYLHEDNLSYLIAWIKNN